MPGKEKSNTCSCCGQKFKGKKGRQICNSCLQRETAPLVPGIGGFNAYYRPSYY